MHGSVIQVWDGCAGAWGGAALRASWQGGLCALAAGLACRLWPRLPAAGRAWLWWLVCLKLTVGLLCVTPPALPVLPASPAPSPASQSPAVPLLPIVPAPSFTHSAKIIVVPIAPPAPNSGGAGAGEVSEPTPTAWLGLLWAVSVLCFAGRDMWHWLRLRRRIGKVTQAVVETDAVTGPQVAGLLRPTILLPKTGLAPEERAMALAHEQAHLRRGDLWWGLLPALTQTLFFVFPPARWAVREYLLAREEACDAEALRVTGAAPAQYARLLLRFASPAAPALGLGAGYRALHRRLTTLPQASATLPPALRRLGLAGLALALPLCLPWRLTAAVPHPGKGAGRQRLPDPATLRFAIRDLGAVDGAETAATGLNDQGQVVGTVESAEHPLSAQAVLWGGRQASQLGALPGDAYCRANGVNDRGQVIASSYSAYDHNRAFLWQDGRRAALAGLDGFPHSKALGISNSGLVVGYAQTGDHDAKRALVARAALWNGMGQPQDLGTLGGDYSAAYGVNDRGQVVGKADTPYLGSTHAFLWQGGRMTDLGTLGGANSLALQVNSGGQVVGYSETGAATHAFLWQSGAMRDLGTLPGATDSEAHGVNDRGQVVGDSDGAAALWQSGRVADLNSLIPSDSGWALQDAAAINAHGQIAGTGLAPDGHTHAFLLTPTGRR